MVVGDIVRRNRIFLRDLARTKSEKLRKKMLSQATDDEIGAILEICVNVMRRRFKLKEAQRRRLEKHKDFLRKLHKLRSRNSVRHVLQTGNGAMFAPLIGPVLSALIGSLITSNL